jgi:polyisoprenoid-binding protein YceI
MNHLHPRRLQRVDQAGAVPRAVALLLALLAPTLGLAADYRALPGSTLAFSSTFQGERFTGHFKSFAPALRFDPARLADSRFEVAIDLASVDSQNTERDDGLRSTDFFNVHRQAQAHYVATRFRSLGQGRFVADGVLSLNGASKPVPLTFTWSGGAKPVLNGTATVRRLDFQVGSGEWADTSLLPNDVLVTTRLQLAPTQVAPR